MHSQSVVDNSDSACSSAPRTLHTHPAHTHPHNNTTQSHLDACSIATPSCPVVPYACNCSFLIGGGCNERLEYVELLVDGDPTLRATGACSETMFRVHWDVTLHNGRSAQIRVVDEGTGLWGHINVDDFRFDWAMQVCVEGGGSCFPLDCTM